MTDQREALWDQQRRERESVTGKTYKLVEEFEAAQKQLERARHEINRAESALANATVALGNWMWPEDGKAGEQFNIWYGNRLVCVTKARPDADPKVTIRGTRS